MNEARHHLVLSREEWRALMKQHQRAAQIWTLPTLKRRAHQVVHPVEDFLFTYYPFKLGKLEQWHPGYGVALECAEDESPAWMQKCYRRENGLLFVDPSMAEEKEKARLFWILDLLQRTAQQAGHFGCFGLHEWAMVYRSEEVRHGKVAALRLPMSEIEKLVESRPLRCSHYDAFRFFTPEARPLNQLQPTLEGRPEQEQPGCIHANMDLYKWAFKCQHWIPGEILLDAFRLAQDLRHLDMRASPYELSAYGMTPVCIETIEGRRQYEEEQRHFAEKAAALRQRLIDALARVCQTFTNPTMPTGALIRGQN